MSRKPVIPFGWMPAAWGLKGKSRLIAQAEYELSGNELEDRLLEIEFGNDPHTLAVKTLQNLYKTAVIDEYEYEIKLSKLEIKEEKELALKLIDIDLKFEKIEKPLYDRKRADILGEPWVSMPTINWDPIKNDKTFFQLDYNEYFLNDLRNNGYTGEEDDIINKWLNDVCISIFEEINDIEGEFATPTRRGFATDQDES
jgi:hypothetical protein